MYAKPMILPLDGNGQIYALQDEKGNTIGTGTREVCEVLLYIITKPASPSISGKINVPVRLAATLASPEIGTDVPRKSYLFFLMHITTWNGLVPR
jgi:hypothetical protein